MEPVICDDGYSHVEADTHDALGGRGDVYGYPHALRQGNGVDDSCLVFRSPASPLLALSAFILYGNGNMDEYLRYDLDGLSLSEFSRYDVNRVGNPKDMPTTWSQDVMGTGQSSCRAIMVY